MMKWCRLYHSLLTCPKVQKLPPRIFKFWVNCLLLASENDPRGTLPPDDVIAFRLGLRARFVHDSLTTCERVALVSGANGARVMHDWSDWNFASDDVNQRVADLRAGKRNVTRNVAPAVHATPQDSDTDTDKKKHPPSEDEKKAPPAADAADAHDSPPAAADDPKPPATTAVVVMRPKLNRAMRLPFETLPDEWRNYAQREFGWNPEKVMDVWEEFHDYWIALPGREGMKLDWLATWRNRCRLVRDRDRKEQKTTHRVGATEASLKFSAAMERRDRLRKGS